MTLTAPLPAHQSGPFWSHFVGKTLLFALSCSLLASAWLGVSKSWIPDRSTEVLSSRHVGFACLPSCCWGLHQSPVGSSRGGRWVAGRILSVCRTIGGDCSDIVIIRWSDNAMLINYNYNFTMIFWQFSPPWYQKGSRAGRLTGLQPRPPPVLSFC